LQKTFVANASHELRTPITRMIIGTEIALSQDRSKEEYQKALSSVLEDSEKLENIISSLLKLAQADLEYGSSNLQKVRIDEMIWSLQQEWNKKTDKHQLLIEVKDLPMDEDLLSIACNPTLLQIAIDNLISNAFKFSDNQPVKCTLEVKDDGIHVLITDTGVGIEPTDADNVFKPFYSSSTKAEHAGSGMGLYMAHKIITLYRGNITIKSQKDQDTTFHIHFPRF